MAPPPAATPWTTRTSGGARTRRRRRWLLAGTVPTLLLAGLAALAAVALQPPPNAAAPTCTVGGYALLPAQAANAATIAAVGDRLRLPRRAVTIALATALQESQLLDLDYGTADSLGLFQQRPSQGWGSPAQVLNPQYASTAFYHHLAAVPGWRALGLAAAAQAVQRSADGAAYADWSGEAASMSAALLGAQPAGVSCSALTGPVRRSSATPPALLAAAHAQLGSTGLLDTVLPAARGWQVASWMVANASRYGLTAVAFDGRRWTRGSGTWRPDGFASRTVSIR